MTNLKIKCDVELPKGFKKFTCRTCYQAIIMAIRYRSAFDNIEYTSDDITWCPVCRLSLKND